MVRSNVYSTILSQTISPCGNFLYAGDVNGVVYVFDLKGVFEHSENLVLCKNKPKLKFSVPNNAEVCSMASSEKFLIIGTQGEITGWEWEFVTSTKRTPKPTWSMTIPSGGGAADALRRCEVNCLQVDEDAGLVYAGCGDNNIYSFSLEDGKVQRTFTSHTDFVHSLVLSRHQLASAGEDGHVKVWDIRDSELEAELVPYEHESLQRPALGRWLGAVDLSDEWLAVGGGPRLSLWHLRSLTCATTFPLEDRGVHVVRFVDDKLIAGGSSQCLHVLELSGASFAEIPSSSSLTLSLVAQTQVGRSGESGGGSGCVVTFAGTSPHVDVCTGLAYRDLVLDID